MTIKDAVSCHTEKACIQSPNTNTVQLHASERICKKRLITEAKLWAVPLLTSVPQNLTHLAPRNSPAEMGYWTEKTMLLEYWLKVNLDSIKINPFLWPLHFVWGCYLPAMHRCQWVQMPGSLKKEFLHQVLSGRTSSSHFNGAHLQGGFFKGHYLLPR